MENRTVLHRVILATAISLVASAAFASPASPDHRADDAWLHQTLTAREAALTRAYNTCNLHALRASLFAGTRISRPEGPRIDPVIEAHDRICGRRRREVLGDSLHVQAVGDHAALVTGIQRFCPLGAEPCHASGVEFARLWILGGGRWRIGWMRRSDRTTAVSRDGRLQRQLNHPDRRDLQRSSPQ
jgi:hypothetical protein